MLLVSVLHFMSANEADAVVAAFRDWMAPGSCLVISAGTSTGTLAALGITTTGMTLTRYNGKLHPERGPAVGYHGGLYWWPARGRATSRPVYAIHDARDPVGAARRIAPHHQPATLAER